MKFRHHLDIEAEARAKSRQLEAEDNQIEEQKRLYLEKSRNDPLLFLRVEIEREEQKLLDLKKRLYEAEKEQYERLWEERGIQFIESSSSSGSKIKFLGRS